MSTKEKDGRRRRKHKKGAQKLKTPKELRVLLSGKLPLAMLGMALFATSVNIGLGIVLSQMGTADIEVGNVLRNQILSGQQQQDHHHRQHESLEMLDPYLAEHGATSNFCTDVPCEKHYPEIDWSVMRFPSMEQRNLVANSKHFHQFANHVGFFAAKTDPQRLTGETVEFDNGTFIHDIQCGYDTTHSDFGPRDDMIDLFNKDRLMPLHHVPLSFIFQHFTDGVLPKIMFQLDIIRNRNITLVLDEPKDPIIVEMISRLGLQYVTVSARARLVVGAKEMYSGCKVPPVHPILWRRARVLLTGKDPSPKPDGPIILLHRSKQNAIRPGRFIDNYDELKGAMMQRYGDRLVEYDSKQFSPAETIDLFSSASAIVGSHGGAFSNLIFVPIGTVIIETVPCRPSGNTIDLFPSFIFYVFTAMLGHTYWRIQYVSSNMNVIMDPEVVFRILDDPHAQTDANITSIRAT
mmetsp:Transcript_14724/g.41685  ORF Transcript_14724/g.41685 Transcript_14724/m.41685 type:complete len:463 (+) Transcript_14724:114-1502(+)|eukprot:CAMPEP_0119562094 /NCGR_PEP_ID=MMETSP1352-20130426/19495_1 /TAXON_ID=265584 /ORGANISM="Stauroneis constricta, Strain CCMP1120" /LENGTH=462 /DNA_ID=CAMNT_0007610441 /DNA_START=48 /DNA_END=1436 /DNA_ORIENTATION=+